MPYYDYYCEECKQEFEAQQSIKEEPLSECPYCKETGKNSIPKRLISKSSFILQGNCWAKDNYSK